MLLKFRQWKDFFFSSSKLSKKDEELVKKLRTALGYTPVQLALYRTAFTHSSMIPGGNARFRPTVEHNERLEFLGDAVIGAVVSEYLYNKFPNQREGFLTQVRSKIVARDSLSRLARELGLTKFIEAHINKPLSRNILGNTLEALVGAIYLDKGYGCAKEVFLQRILLSRVNVDDLVKHEFDYKSRLLELVQKMGGSANFETFEETQRGDRLTLTFSSTLRINNELMGNGSGTSKKAAEQQAAEQAYSVLSTKLEFGD